MGQFTQPQKVLILAANPIDTSRLRLDKEVAKIQAVHRQAKYREEIEIISEWTVGVDNLRQSLLYYKPNMIHFCGHGEGDDGLVLENENGKKQLVSSKSLADLFKLFKNYVECVVLNACYSKVQAEAIHQHINCVIGMNKAIGDKAAIEFSTGFYDALANGRNYQDSFDFGCNAISLKSIPESQTPQIKIRDVSKSLIDPDFINTKSKKTGIPQNIFSSSTDNFVGRERELERLHQQLQCNHEVVIAAVEGMGGVGKTELAIQYSLLHLQLQNYSGGICWLQAREQDIGLQIINFARTSLGLNPPDDLELPERVRWCWNHWNKGNTLIVLDDVTNYGDIKSYLPPQPSQFKVLITTRLKLDLASSLYLEVLQEADALELLTQLVGEEKVNKELGKAKELCQRLGNLPLALQLVGFYIKKRKISLAEILRRLEKKGLGHPSLVVKENDPTWTSDIKRGVVAAFELSWEELSKPAQELGCLLSLFAFAPIPWSLVENTAVEQDSEESEDTIEELEDARLELESLHLLEGEHIYQFHQLIQEFFRNKQNNLAIAEIQKRAFVTEMLSIAQQIPDTPTLLDIESVSDAIPHLKEVAENLITMVVDKDLLWAFVGIIMFYQERGLYTSAEHWLERCLSTSRQRLGEEHLYVAGSLNGLAEIYQKQGRYEQAESLCLQALEMTKKLLGEEHLYVATSLNNLAEIYQEQARYKEAESLHLQVLEMTKKLLGEEHPSVATSLNNLALLYGLQGRHKEAETLDLQALEMRKKLLGEEHPNTASSLNSLAVLYLEQGWYEEAESLFLQALELEKKLLGEKHLSIASSLNNQAGLYLEKGQYEQAELLYLQTLELNKKLLGEEHPSVALSLNNLATLYKKQGRYEQAELLYLQTLELNKKLLGEEHPYVAGNLNNLAGLYEKQGRYEEAESLYLQALKIVKKLFGEEHPYMATSLNNLAGLYESQGRYEEAESLYLQALTMTKKFLGEEHPSVATSLNNLALLYNLQKRYEQAEPLFLKALELYKKLLGDEHPDTARSLNNLAGLYSEQGRYEEAEPLYLKALEFYKKLFGDEHPDTARSLNNLAAIYRKQRRYSEAELLYLKALELYKKLLGEQHPLVGNSLNNLAFLYNEQGRYSEAESLYLKALEVRKKSLGKEHLLVGASLNNLAVLYTQQKRYSEAELLYQQALEIAELSLGVNHPNTITFRENLQYFRDIRATTPHAKETAAKWQRD